MPKDRFNEAEKYLIQNWRQAYQVQTSMAEIRKKYTEVCGRILETMRARHKELDRCDLYVTQFWDTGYMGVGRKAWKQKGFGMPGIYIWNLRLEVILDDGAVAPWVGIWAGKKPGTDEEGVQQIRSAASKVLAKDELERCERGPGDSNVLWYHLTESRQDLANMILENDGQRFVDCLVSHAEVFAKLIPAMDKAFSKSGQATDGE